MSESEPTTALSGHADMRRWRAYIDTVSEEIWIVSAKRKRDMAGPATDASREAACVRQRLAHAYHR